MKYSLIRNLDTANGPWMRVSFFCSGCRHKCPWCFNYELRDFNIGRPFTQGTITEILSLLENDYISGLSLLGWEPLDEKNQESILALILATKQRFPDKTIWCYSWYTYEYLIWDWYNTTIEEIFKNIDTLVDGKFIANLADYKLKFRWSSNQRLINIPETQKQWKIIWSTAVDDQDIYYMQK